MDHLKLLYILLNLFYKDCYEADFKNIIKKLYWIWGFSRSESCYVLFQRCDKAAKIGRLNELRKDISSDYFS